LDALEINFFNDFTEVADARQYDMKVKRPAVNISGKRTKDLNKLPINED
jgi:hypothetical protein